MAAITTTAIALTRDHTIQRSEVGSPGTELEFAL